jgi:hypothetical protein
VLERRAGVPPSASEADKLKTIDADQQGAGARSFKMLKNALDRPNGATAGDFYEIQPRSIFYEHLRFTDRRALGLLHQPDRRDPGSEHMKVQARKKIAANGRRPRTGPASRSSSSASTRRTSGWRSC